MSSDPWSDIDTQFWATVEAAEPPADDRDQFADHLPAYIPPDPANADVKTDGPGWVDGQARTPDPAPAVQVGPVLMSEGWDEEDPVIEPTLVPVEGGLPLLHAGDTTMVIGRFSTGKSWLMYLAVLLVVRAGGVALIVDYENNRRLTRAKLRAMGVTAEEASRIAYWSSPGSLLAQTRGGSILADWLAAWRPALIAIDSVSKACRSAALDDSSPAEYLRWETEVTTPAKRAGAAVLLLDHVGHAQHGASGGAGSGSAGFRARGASSKADQAATAYLMEVVEPWSRDRSGSAKLTVLKARHGERAEGDVAAEMHVQVLADDRLSVSLVAPPPVEVAADGKFKPTHVMEMVSRAVEDAGELRIRSLEAAVSAKKETTARAVKLLLADGFLKEEKGARNARILSSVRPYRKPETPAMADGVVPVADAPTDWSSGQF